MITSDSSSSSYAAIESQTMSGSSNNRNHRQSLTKRTASIASRETDEGKGDSEVWENFNRSFNQVQSVLDRNRTLIQQVNENHQSRIPDNMVKNVALIQEINGNISKVVTLYADLSTNFSTVFRDQCSQNGVTEQAEDWALPISIWRE